MLGMENGISVTEKRLVWAFEWVGKALIGVCLYYVAGINSTLKEISATQQSQTRILDIQEIRLKTLEDDAKRRDSDYKDRLKDLENKVFRNK
jgi:hypothetical protein